MNCSFIVKKEGLIEISLVWDIRSLSDLFSKKKETAKNFRGYYAIAFILGAFDAQKVQ